MNTIISDSSLSTEIPPSQSFTKDEIDAQCVAIGLYPSPPNREPYRPGVEHLIAQARCIVSKTVTVIRSMPSSPNPIQPNFITVQGECPDINGDCKHLFAV